MAEGQRDQGEGSLKKELPKSLNWVEELLRSWRSRRIAEAAFDPIVEGLRGGADHKALATFLPGSEINLLAYEPGTVFRVSARGEKGFPRDDKWLIRGAECGNTVDIFVSNIGTFLDSRDRVIPPTRELELTFTRWIPSANSFDPTQVWNILSPYDPKEGKYYPQRIENIESIDVVISPKRGTQGKRS